MKNSFNLFWLLLLLIVVINTSSKSLIYSKAQKISFVQEVSSQQPQSQDIIRNIGNDPLRFLCLGLFGALMISALLLGLILDVKFIIKFLRDKTLGLAGYFSRSGFALTDALKLLCLLIFFYSVLKFIQISFIDFYGPGISTMALGLNAVFEIFCILTIVGFFGRGAFGWVKKNIHSQLFESLTGYISILPVIGAALLLSMVMLKLFQIKPQPLPAVSFIFRERNLFNVILLSLEVVILAPVFEELLFRGVIYRLLRSRISFGLSSVASAAVFSLLHNSLFALLPIIILGVFFAYTYERTKNIFIPIFLHSLHNLLTLTGLLLIKTY